MIMIMTVRIFLKLKLGFISSDEIRLTYLKINLDLSVNDVESMLKYFNIHEQKYVNIQDFVRNFSEQYYQLEVSYVS